MAFIPVPATVGVEIRMLEDDQRCENTLYFRYSSAITPSTLEDLGDALLTWWGGFYAPIACTSVVLREIYLVDLTSATGPSWTTVPPTTEQGANSDEQMPNSTTIAVSFRTAQRGRSFRGRNYFVGLTGGAVSGNRVIGATVDAIQACYEQLLTVASGLSATWVVASRFTNNAPRSSGVTTPVTAVVITDTVVDSQRRRLPGRGT